MSLIVLVCGVALVRAFLDRLCCNKNDPGIVLYGAAQPIACGEELILEDDCDAHKNAINAVLATNQFQSNGTTVPAPAIANESATVTALDANGVIVAQERGFRHGGGGRFGGGRFGGGRGGYGGYGRYGGYGGGYYGGGIWPMPLPVPVPVGGYGTYGYPGYAAQPLIL